MLNLVYETVKTIINKEQNGLLTPTEFNLVAGQAQNEVFREYFEDNNLDINKKNRGVANKGYGNLDFNVRQRISNFAASATLLRDTSTTNNYWGLFTLPIDLYLVEDDGIMSLPEPVDGIDGPEYTVTPSVSKVIEEIDRSRLNYILNSEIAPTATFPIYTREDSTIRVYPQSIPYINVEYIRKPLQPNWTYTTVTGTDGAVSELHNPANVSFQDLELDDSEFSNITLRVLSYFGINLREEQVVQVAELLKDKTKRSDEGSPVR